MPKKQKQLGSEPRQSATHPPYIRQRQPYRANLFGQELNKRPIWRLSLVSGLSLSLVIASILTIIAANPDMRLASNGLLCLISVTLAALAIIILLIDPIRDYITRRRRDRQSATTNRVIEDAIRIVASNDHITGQVRPTKNP
jgi:hypothetical protein